MYIYIYIPVCSWFVPHVWLHIPQDITMISLVNLTIYSPANLIMVHLKFATYVILIPMNTLSDMLYVWNMYQHLPQKSPSFVGKNIYQHHGSHLGLVIKQGVLENEPISSRIFPAMLHWCWIFLLMFEHQRVNPDVFIAIEIPVRSYNFPIKPMKSHEIPFSSLFISLFISPCQSPKKTPSRHVPPRPAIGTRWKRCWSSTMSPFCLGLDRHPSRRSVMEVS